MIPFLERASLDVRNIWCFQGGDFLGIELDIKRKNRLFDMLHGRAAPATCQRAPRNNCHLAIMAKRQDLSLFLAILELFHLSLALSPIDVKTVSIVSYRRP